MDISNIVTKEYIEVDIDERLGKVRSLFDDENPKGIVVTEDGDYAGVITEKDLLQSHLEDDAKAGAVMKPGRANRRSGSVPKVERDEDVREVARVLVEGDTKVAPVFEGGKLWGIVTQDAILEAVIDNLDALTVDQIYTENVVTVDEDTTVGKAINLLREHGISRLPVVDTNALLTGVVTTHDIVNFVVRNMNKSTHGERSGDTERMLDLPVYDVMNEPATTITIDASVKTATERMLENDYSGLIVTPEENDELVAGVITKTDILRALSFTEQEHMDVQITNISLLDDTLDRLEIQDAIAEVADKHQRMQVLHAHVRFHEHKEKLRGTSLIRCEIRIRTDEGQIAGTGEGYGSENAFRIALDHLERRVLEQKGMRDDEEYRGQLLRKLGEL